MTETGETSTLGQYLRQERKRRGITIEQVASATKIGVKQLHALESDQYSKLPAKPFVRGFVISYCRFIGLDPQETLIQFNPFIEERAQERPNRESGHSGYAFEKREGTEQSRTALSVVLGSFVVIGGIAFMILKPSLHNGRHAHLDKLRALQPSPSSSSEPSGLASLSASILPSPNSSATALALTSPTPLTLPTTSPSVAKLAAPVAVATPSKAPTKRIAATPSPAQTVATAPSATPTPNASASPNPDVLNSGLGLKPSETAHRLVVRAINSVWVRYQVDDKPIMQFPLRTGRILVLRCKKSMILQVGNPDDVELSHNGAGYQPSATHHPITWQNDSTFIFPTQQAEIIEEPLKGQKPLSSRPVPPPRAPQPTPSTT